MPDNASNEESIANEKEPFLEKKEARISRWVETCALIHQGAQPGKC